MSADHVTLATGASAATPTADEARAELLAFARRLHRACGLRDSDGTPSATVARDGFGWRATAHLLGRRLRLADACIAGVEDGAAGAWGHGATPEDAIAAAIEAWRENARWRRAEAERAETNAREVADGWRRLCAEVGA